MTVLPEKLARYVDDARLAENAANYPEMHRELTAGQTMAALAIQDILLNLPLTHSTPAPAAKLLSGGLLPGKQVKRMRPLQKTNTYRIDRSLGLDEYAFMRWGEIETKGLYGNTTVAIDTKAVLLSPQTVVSPSDITDSPSIVCKRSYRNQPPSAKLEIELYFDSLVTGGLWLEITARRILEKLLRGEIDGTLRMHTSAPFGEVKHYGAVAAENIVGDLTTLEDKAAESKRQYHNGISTPLTLQAIAVRDSYLQLVGTSVDFPALPETMGVDESVPRDTWANITELANS